MSSRTRAVQRLKAVVDAVLTSSEQIHLTAAVNTYTETRDVNELTRALAVLLNTPAKRQVIGRLRPVIYGADRPMYDRMTFGLLRDVNDVAMNLAAGRVSNEKVSNQLHEMLPRRLNNVIESPVPPFQATTTRGQLQKRFLNKSVRPFVLSNLPNWETGLAASLKHVVIDRSKSRTGRLGLSVRGGAEHGFGIYVSHVEEESQAEEHGLQPGDLIESVNGVSFSRITIAEARKIISSCQTLNMQIRHLARVPYETNRRYIWVDERGSTTSPPPDTDHSAQRYTSVGDRKSGLMLSKDIDERKVNLTVGGKRSVGITVRGGNEVGLGIYISGVEKGSAAHLAGLRTGNQILDINGISFLDISHTQAIAVLTTSKRLMMTVKDVGKIPYAMTSRDQAEWIMGDDPQLIANYDAVLDSSLSVSSSSSLRPNLMNYLDDSKQPVFKRGVGSQLMHSSFMPNGQTIKMALLGEQARRKLAHDEMMTLNYYLSEYLNGRLAVESLVLAFFQLFTTRPKMTLMEHVRSLIFPKDLQTFDAMWLIKKIEESEKKRHRNDDLIILEDSFTKHSLSSATATSNGSPAISSSDLRAKVRNRMRTSDTKLRKFEQKKKSSGTQTNSRDSEDAECQLLVSPEVVLLPYHAEIHLRPISAPVTTPTKSYDVEEPLAKTVCTQTEAADVTKDDRLLKGHFNDTTSPRPEAPSNTSKRSVELTTDSPLKSAHINQQRFDDNFWLYQSDPYAVRSQQGMISKQSEVYENELNNGRNDNLMVSEYSFHIHSPHSKQVDDFAVPGSSEDIATSRLLLNDAPFRVARKLSGGKVLRDASRSTTRRRRSQADIGYGPDNNYNGSGTTETLRPPEQLSVWTDPFQVNSSVLHFNGETTQSNSDPMQERMVDNKSQTQSSVSTVLSPQSIFSNDNEYQATVLSHHTVSSNRELLQVIRIYKTKPTLGIAIAGGADTRHALPCIVKIQETGSAYNSKLREGHVIVEIDGISLYGLSHEQCAKLMTDCFKDRLHLNYLELLVIDADDIVI